MRIHSSATTPNKFSAQCKNKSDKKHTSTFHAKRKHEKNKRENVQQQSSIDQRNPHRTTIPSDIQTRKNTERNPPPPCVTSNPPPPDCNPPNPTAHHSHGQANTPQESVAKRLPSKPIHFSTAPAAKVHIHGQTQKRKAPLVQHCQSTASNPKPASIPLTCKTSRIKHCTAHVTAPPPVTKSEAMKCVSP